MEDYLERIRYEKFLNRAGQTGTKRESNELVGLPASVTQIKFHKKDQLT